MWLGPPCRKIMMTDFAWPQPFLFAGVSVALAACRRKMSARLRPSRPAPPTRKNSRRLNPSHVRPTPPGMLNIMLLSVEQKRRTVQEGPGQILGRLQPVPARFQIHHREFFFGRRTVQNCEIKFFDELFVVGLAIDERRDVVVRSVDGFADGCAI